MFEIGELIHYGGTGVCEVKELRSRTIPGTQEDAMYYVLQPLYQSCTISAPVDSKKVFMRPIISREEAEELIDKIPSISAEAYHNRVLRQLAEHYEETINRHDCESLVKLTMSIYAKKKLVEEQKRKFGAVDERFMRRAEELLFGELGAALGIEKDEVSAYISKRVKAAENAS